MSYRIAILSTLLTLSAMGQDELPSVFLRYVALGEEPPFIARVVDGIREQVEPPKGSRPPLKLYAPATKSVNKNVSVRLGKIPAYREMNPNLGPPSLYLDVGSKKRWANVKMPTSRLSTAILLRRPKGPKPTWDNVGVKVIRDDLRVFPKDHLRLVNMTPYKAVYKLGNSQEETLRPGKVKVLQVDPENDILKLFVIGKKKRPERLYSNKLELGKGQRKHAYIYPADSGKTAKSALLKIFSETYVMPRPAKKSGRTTAKTTGGN